MKVPATSPWTEHKDVLKELEKQAKAIGLKVVLEEFDDYLDAQLFKGKDLVTYMHYDPAENAWASETHGRFFTTLEDIMGHLKGRASSAPKGNQLVITVDYGKGKVPQVSPDTIEAVMQLLPGKPKSATAS